MSRLTLKEKISYGLGDFGNGFMFDLGQAYLLIFYTDVAGLPGAVAGGVFLFTKIFDAFMDPIAGSFVDGRSRIGRFGRFRPVMMYSSIALAVLTVFTFLTPGPPRASTWSTPTPPTWPGASSTRSPTSRTARWGR